MVNELCFTRFKSSLLESLKALCEHDTSFVEIWWFIHTHNKQMQSSSPSAKITVSPKRLSKLMTKREVSFDLERSNKNFWCRAKAVDLEVDPSLPFDLDSLGGDQFVRDKDIGTTI